MCVYVCVRERVVVNGCDSPPVSQILHWQRCLQWPAEKIAHLSPECLDFVRRWRVCRRRRLRSIFMWLSLPPLQVDEQCRRETWAEWRGRDQEPPVLA